MIKTILMIRENYQENNLYKGTVQLLKWFWATLNLSKKLFKIISNQKMCTSYTHLRDPHLQR